MFFPLLVSRMGWFSFLGKNKQDPQEPEGAYVARTEEPKVAAERSRSKRGSKGGHEAVDPVLPEKKRARRRLVGAIALALAVIIGLPMVLDSEPKPLSGDIAIEIPSKDKPYSAGSSKVPVEQSLDPNETLVDPGKPGKPSANASASASVSATANIAAKPSATPQPSTPLAVTPAANSQIAALTKPPVASTAPITPAKPETSPPAKPESKPEPKPPVKPETKPESKPEHKPPVQTELKPENKPEHKPETKPVTKPTPEPKPATKPTPEPRTAKPATSPESDDASRAQAILEGKPEPKTAESKAADSKTEAKPKKYVLQVAALATQEKIDELQGKLRDAGISSHTQKVAVEGGTRTRIRVGPFADKDEALKMRERLARLGLNGTLIPQ